MTTTVPPATRARTAGWWWFALTAAAIAVYAPLPYLTAPLAELARDDVGLAAHYAAQPGWVRAALLVHAACGGIALLLSPLQFAARLRARAPGMHRAAGRVTLIAIAIGGASGLLLAPFSFAGPVGTAGFGSLALLWTLCAALAFRAIRRGDINSHRRWAIRLFALTYAGVTLRLWVMLLMPILAATGVPEEDLFERAYLFVPFLSWLPNVALAELLLHRRRQPHPQTPEPHYNPGPLNPTPAPTTRTSASDLSRAPPPRRPRTLQHQPTPTRCTRASNSSRALPPHPTLPSPTPEHRQHPQQRAPRRAPRRRPTPVRRDRPDAAPDKRTTAQARTPTTGVTARN
ncbi:DUF2306 domain-containing protein [Actinocorallia sp. A-T 12471]|uniref:DUF2306 domain-containing protein n=1 Tax=Actinocorallia sp. A-T 12471 TaxID=3089813 RepID=UPI0029CB3BC4|nr:DUF2306 domain-containing protein [Actinocorallia sp. A-T 12471]MDX6741052.1 DUF2306 domain-containing protein [Actinocorallia sp. A-T 12471]